MKKFLIPCLWLIVMVPVALAQAPQGKLIEDHWDAAFLEGALRVLPFPNPGTSRQGWRKTL